MPKKDRNRALTTGLIHRDGKTVQMDPCPIDGCAHRVDPRSELKLCSECDRIGRVVKYGTIQVLLDIGVLKKGPTPEQKASGGPALWIPKPGRERAAILDAAAKAGMSPERMNRGGRA